MTSSFVDSAISSKLYTREENTMRHTPLNRQGSPRQRFANEALSRSVTPLPQSPILLPSATGQLSQPPPSLVQVRPHPALITDTQEVDPKPPPPPPKKRPLFRWLTL